MGDTNTDLRSYFRGAYPWADDLTTLASYHLEGEADATAHVVWCVGQALEPGGEDDAVIPAGIIVLWSGLVAAIPAGWSLCDGTNGTPDLRGLFIKGATGEPGGTGGGPYTPQGAVSQPTFTGSALSTHSHGTGTLAVSAHAGTAVADHAAHTHSVTSNVAVADHASHTHTSASSTATPKLVTGNTSTGVSVVTGGPSATLTHAVTNNAVTSGNPSATLSHSVTQPSDHTLSGSTAAVSAGTPSGTVSQPTFTGQAATVEPAYYSLAFLMKAA